MLLPFSQIPDLKNIYGRFPLDIQGFFPTYALQRLSLHYSAVMASDNKWGVVEPE